MSQKKALCEIKEKEIEMEIVNECQLNVSITDEENTEFYIINCQELPLEIKTIKTLKKLKSYRHMIRVNDCHKRMMEIIQKRVFVYGDNFYIVDHKGIQLLTDVMIPHDNTTKIIHANGNRLDFRSENLLLMSKDEADSLTNDKIDLENCRIMVERGLYWFQKIRKFVVIVVSNGEIVNHGLFENHDTAYNFLFEECAKL